MVILPLNTTKISEILKDPDGIILILKAFVMGFRFDTVIVCYVMSIITLLLLIAWSLRLHSILYYRIVHGLATSFFSICIIISIADIPYFKYFFHRFNVQAFEWMDSPAFVFKMIFEDISYVFLFLILAGIIGIYIYLMRRIWKTNILRILQNNNDDKLKIGFNWTNLLLFIFTLGLIFIGMRGRIEKKSPIRAGTAYFSNYPLINQMGLNPVFTLMKSWEEKHKSSNHKLNLMNEKEAISLANQEINRMWKDSVRQRIPILDKNTNVILVLMESMGNCHISHYGSSDYTPNLDQLIDESISYDSVYSAGIHTFNGVYSSLFGEPALMDKHTMKYTVIPEMKGGLPAILKKNGYATYYFTTHDEQFDNIGGFLSANEVENIISVKDYPSSEVKSTLGVPDHVMFNRVIHELNQRKNNQPFFTTILTASNHGPYIIPDGIDFHPRAKKIESKIVEYADWAIGKFLNDAKKTRWFKNTLFIFMADHGAFMGENPYEIPLSYHHTPYLFYKPDVLSPSVNNSLGLQMDTPAMICSYLGLRNSLTLGVPFDLHPRKYIYFSDDDKLGVMDRDFLYVWNRNGREFLYKYKSEKTENCINQYKLKAQEMQRYAFSMLMKSASKLKSY